MRAILQVFIDYLSDAKRLIFMGTSDDVGSWLDRQVKQQKIRTVGVLIKILRSAGMRLGQTNLIAAVYESCLERDQAGTMPDSVNIRMPTSRSYTRPSPLRESSMYCSGDKSVAGHRIFFDEVSGAARHSTRSLGVKRSTSYRGRNDDNLLLAAQSGAPSIMAGRFLNEVSSLHS